ncbi:hypothetical protein JKF63_02238 [Porcisia hertigi]|uniref:Uncharacterized protein n=1 Tax=Porcisia hertigi TaxID=2761500 RepID=A0A836I7T7_9TRYP|nr:hypothetical protein JKF63_02238 [Porcisia hertigi]
MSFVSTGLPRSRRLLPLESTEVLGLTDSFLLHVLQGHHDRDCNPSDEPSDSKRLHEHVSLYWDQQHAYRSYQHRLLREVRSTRGPVRFAGFPQVRIGSRRTEVVSTAARAPALDGTECSTESTSVTGGVTLPSQPRLETAAAAFSSVPKTIEGALPPPRSLAAWNWISLVAPYERLLCPSLLYSALLTPSVGGCTSLLYGTQPPSPAPASASTSAVSGCVWARWSTYTCQSLWTLHTVAAEASLPVQEVYVMCAGTITYLDVILTAGRVWSELEELWGNDLALELESEKETMRADCLEGSETGARLQLSSLKSLLSQPAQTFTALLQHARVLLEALTRTTASSTSFKASPMPDAARTAFPRPLAPWLAEAMEKEIWSTAANPWVAGSSGSSASKPGSVAVQILRHAAAQWLSRRGATVTAATATGIRAVPLTPRDLCVSRGSDAAAPASLQSSARMDDSSMRAGSLAPCTGTRRHSITSPRFAGSATAPVSSTFEAFEPHDMPREQHPFFLPPLPQDPALTAFAAVWRRTLQRCVLEPDILRKSLRQVILGCAGQRCEELLQESTQRRLQQPHHAVESLTVSESRDGPPPPRVLAHSSDAVGKNSATTDSARVAVPLVSAISSTAVEPPPSRLLLTSDPAATSFRVLGPRLGEWLASTYGGWCGFRGELYRCVGPPSPPPPLPSPPSSACAAQARRRLPASSRSHSSAAIHTPSAEQLVELFVDGALEVESVGGVSSSSSCTGAVSRAASFLYSVEELADRLCRLGSALPRYATEVSGDCLRPADAAYVREVLQRHCLPLLLACQRCGIQQWRLRGWMKGITLTLLDNSGVESRVITPAKLMELGLQHARSAGGSDIFATTTTLRMVVDGALSGTLAFLEHVQKRSERTVRWLRVRRLESGGVGIDRDGGPSPASTPKITTTAVEVVLLRRAEESALFSIFQSHPSALLLAGCGVQRLALPLTITAPERRHVGASSPVHPLASTKLLLVRTCGIAIDLDLQECYEHPKFLRLRKPRSLVSHSSREATATAGVQWLPLPPELGTASERVTLRHIRGMLQYYLRSLDTTTASSVAGGTAGNSWATSGMKRVRADAEGEAMERPHEPQSTNHESFSGAIQLTRPSAALSKADTSETSVADLPRTTLFAIDRAAILYVLRHHPHYYQQVKGCGIKEVYVAAKADHASTALCRTGSLAEDAITSPSFLSSPAAGPCRAVVIIERVCGQSVEVDVEACYDKGCEGVPLRPFMMLA